MTKEELNLYLEGLIAKQATQSYRDTFAIGQGALPAVSAPQLPQFAESPLAQQQMAGALKDKPSDLTENFGKSYDRLTSGLTAAGTIASTMIDGLNLGTYNTDQQSQMRQVNSIDPSQAYQAMSTLTAAKTFDKTDFGGADTGGILKNIGTAAAAGSTFGPIGAIVAGLGAAGTTLLGNHKAQKDANIATAKSQMAYNDGVNSINNGLTNYNYDKMIHNRTNILAEGGWKNPLTGEEADEDLQSQYATQEAYEAALKKNAMTKAMLESSPAYRAQTYKTAAEIQKERAARQMNQAETVAGITGKAMDAAWQAGHYLPGIKNMIDYADIALNGVPGPWQSQGSVSDLAAPISHVMSKPFIAEGKDFIDTAESMMKQGMKANDPVVQTVVNAGNKISSLGNGLKTTGNILGWVDDIGDTVRTMKNIFTTPNDQYWEKRYGTNKYAEGGPITTVDEGGSHAESQFGGVPMGFDAAGNQNLVEQGESVDKEKQYVFSDQLKMPKSFIDKYKLKAGTFSDGIKEFTDRGYKDIEGDNIARKTYQAFRDDLMNTQETEKMKKAARMAKKMGLQAPPIDEYGMPIEQPHVMANGDFLRGLQPLGDVIGLAYNAFDTYRPAEVQTAQHAREISATPITTTLQTTPLDNVFEMRQAQNMTNQVINNLNNSNSSGRTASILAAQVNGLNQQGNAYRQAVNFENQRRTNEATFNRGTQQMNSQMGLQAAMANAQHDDAYRHMLGQQSQFNVSTKDQWKRGNDAAIGQEISNIFNSFGGIGTEIWNRNAIDALIESGYAGSLNDAMALLYGRKR